MFNISSFIFIILSIAGGLLTLLGSVGIFISLIVQRRLDRLQDILEEFINLSYRSEINLTGQMYNLIEKYQMHYIFPSKPRQMILFYIDLNIFFILVLWLSALLWNYQPPPTPMMLFQVIPLLIGTYASLFFRRLLRSTINLENPLLETIIPAPTRLRSISFLSHFVNISVKSILKQARLTLCLKLFAKEESPRIEVYLKEELSYDDFFYYLVIFDANTTYFVSFGEISFHFPPDPITKKPVPACRNLNVPLGEFYYGNEPDKFQATFLVFTRGEKHPVQYIYDLPKGANCFTPQGIPDMTINHQIIYEADNDRLRILDFESNLPYFKEFSSSFLFKGERWYLDRLIFDNNSSSDLKVCSKNVFID